MWEKDVGRHQASNYGLLQTIFEVNFRLFSESINQKKIIFVIRDFEETGNKRDRIRERLTGDLQNIWGMVHKTEEHKFARLSDFFSTDFYFFPHFNYQKDQFMDESGKLKSRFEDKKDNSIYLHGEDNNVPIDGLPHYLNQIWTAIRSDKDINLPGEKRILSEFRCGEIRKEIIDKVKPELVGMIKESQRGKVADFLQKGKDIYEKSVAEFKKQTSQYDPEVVESVKAELKHAILEDL